MDQPAGQFPDPPIPEFALQLITAGVIQTDVCFGGDRFRQTFAPGDFVLAPANVETNYSVDNPFSLFVLGFPPEPYTRFLEQSEIPLSRDFGPLHRGAFRDPLIQQLIQRMYQESIGLASQSHMTDIFRQNLGVTPGCYRKEVKG